MIDPVAIASSLWTAEQTATPVPFLTRQHPSLDRPTARKIARANDALLREEFGEPIGWKLGWTSAAMRDALGVEQPNWGTLWPRHVVDATTPLHRFIHPKIEPELVYRPATDLRGRPSADDVAAAGGEWALGLEIVDPRFPSFEFDALDNTADNSSRAGVRIGAFARLDPAGLPGLEVVFSDGVTTRTGRGEQAMGSPYEAVAWLVAELDNEGQQVTAGQFVFTGGLTAPFDAAVGATFSLRSADLPPVGLTFV